MATTMVDQIPTDFVLKVYETKALAEEGNELNALYVFNNGRDGDTADELVSNGGQYINGTDTAGTSSKLTDTNARFGTRLVGKTVKNTTDTTEATITARDSKTESSNVQETGGDTGHKEVIPKKPKKTHTGNVGYSHPPTTFMRNGKETPVPESLVHEKLVGNKRQFVLSGEDKETGITAKEVHEASDGQSTQRSLAEYDKERRSQRSKTPKPKTSPSKGKKGNTSKTPKSITVPSKFDLMGKALVQQAETRLKLIQLKSNL